MLLVSTPWHVVSALLIFLLGATVSLAVGQQLKTGNKRSLVLYVWHTLFCMTYLWFVLTSGGDAIGYYKRAIDFDVMKFEFGTAAIDYLTTLFVQGLGVSLLGAFLIYNIFGAIGLLLFDACLCAATKDKTRRTRRLANLIVFLPSVSFWSSGIGKDSLSFMAASLALWATLNLGRRAWAMALAVAVMLFVRPHIAGMMVMAAAVASLLESKASIGKRVFLGGVAVAVAAALVPLALKYSGVGEGASSKEVADYIEGRQGQNMEGGGSVDISSMSLPEQLLTYLFRPVIFEARNFTSLASAIENLVLLYLFIAWIRSVIRKNEIRQSSNRVFLWTYSLMAWVILATTTANLGIAVRQKWMFMPMLIFLFISVIGRPRKTASPPRVLLPHRHYPEIT